MTIRACSRSPPWPTLKSAGQTVLRVSLTSPARSSWPAQLMRCSLGSRRRSPVISPSVRVSSSSAVDELRAQVRLGPLTQALVHYAWAATHTGDWSAAVTAGEEAASLARDTRQPQYGVTGELMAAYARALLGNASDLDATLATSERRVLALQEQATADNVASCSWCGSARRRAQRRCIPPSLAGLRRKRRCLPSVYAVERDSRCRRGAARSGRTESLLARNGRSRPRRRSEQSAISLPRTGLREARSLRPMTPPNRSSPQRSRRISRRTRSCSLGRCSRSGAGCVVDGASPIRASRYAAASSCSTCLVRRPGENERGRNSARQVNESVRGRRMPVTASRRKSSGSRDSRPWACPIGKSVSNSFCLIGRSAPTSIASIPSSGSPGAVSCAKRWRALSPTEIQSFYSSEAPLLGPGSLSVRSDSRKPI